MSSSPPSSPLCLSRELFGSAKIGKKGFLTTATATATATLNTDTKTSHHVSNQATATPFRAATSIPDRDLNMNYHEPLSFLHSETMTTNGGVGVEGGGLAAAAADFLFPAAPTPSLVDSLPLDVITTTARSHECLSSIHDSSADEHQPHHHSVMQQQIHHEEQAEESTTMMQKPCEAGGIFHAPPSLCLRPLPKPHSPLSPMDALPPQTYDPQHRCRKSQEDESCSNEATTAGVPQTFHFHQSAEKKQQIGGEASQEDRQHQQHHPHVDLLVHRRLRESAPPFQPAEKGHRSEGPASPPPVVRRRFDETSFQYCPPPQAPSRGEMLSTLFTVYCASDSSVRVVSVAQEESLSSEEKRPHQQHQQQAAPTTEFDSARLSFPDVPSQVLIQSEIQRAALATPSSSAHHGRGPQRRPTIATVDDFLADQDDELYGSTLRRCAPWSAWERILVDFVSPLHHSSTSYASQIRTPQFSTTPTTILSKDSDLFPALDACATPPPSHQHPQKTPQTVGPSKRRIVAPPPTAIARLPHVTIFEIKQFLATEVFETVPECLLLQFGRFVLPNDITLAELASIFGPRDFSLPAFHSTISTNHTNSGSRSGNSITESFRRLPVLFARVVPAFLNPAWSDDVDQETAEEEEEGEHNTKLRHCQGCINLIHTAESLKGQIQVLRDANRNRKSCQSDDEEQLSNDDNVLGQSPRKIFNSNALRDAVDASRMEEQKPHEAVLLHLEALHTLGVRLEAHESRLRRENMRRAHHETLAVAQQQHQQHQNDNPHPKQATATGPFSQWRANQRHHQDNHHTNRIDARHHHHPRWPKPQHDTNNKNDNLPTMTKATTGHHPSDRRRGEDI